MVKSSWLISFLAVVAAALAALSNPAPALAQDNTKFGTGALPVVTTGTNNTAIGFNALL